MDEESVEQNIEYFSLQCSRYSASGVGINITHISELTFDKRRLECNNR